MSGHSHWAGIKHRKGINDAKRANTFTKFGRLITIAARESGKNPEFNFKLKLAIDQARAVNMPKENIERAIKRGTGELKDGAEIQEVLYEAYGPGQIAMLIKAATDNKNRTLGEIKAILTKAGGKMVPSGSASFLFKQAGISFIPLQKVPVSQDDKIGYEKLLERLDDQEDVQEIFDNL
jgi:YebC/PmpR family DNA-binding regulatory protein